MYTQEDSNEDKSKFQTAIDEFNDYAEKNPVVLELLNRGHEPENIKKVLSNRNVAVPVSIVDVTVDEGMAVINNLRESCKEIDKQIEMSKVITLENALEDELFVSLMRTYLPPTRVSVIMDSTHNSSIAPISVGEVLEEVALQIEISIRELRDLEEEKKHKKQENIRTELEYVESELNQIEGKSFNRMGMAGAFTGAEDVVKEVKNKIEVLHDIVEERAQALKIPHSPDPKLDKILEDDGIEKNSFRRILDRGNYGANAPEAAVVPHPKKDFGRGM